MRSPKNVVKENTMPSRVCMVAVRLLASCVFCFALQAQDFKKQVIYQVVTDRFYDGDTTNDNPAKSPGLFDGTHTNWQADWGGEFAGNQAQLSYLKGVGGAAIVVP